MSHLLELSSGNLLHYNLAMKVTTFTRWVAENFCSIPIIDLVWGYTSFAQAHTTSIRGISHHFTTQSWMRLNSIKTDHPKKEAQNPAFLPAVLPIAKPLKWPLRSIKHETSWNYSPIFETASPLEMVNTGPRAVFAASMLESCRKYKPPTCGHV